MEHSKNINSILNSNLNFLYLKTYRNIFKYLNRNKYKLIFIPCQIFLKKTTKHTLKVMINDEGSVLDEETEEGWSSGPTLQPQHHWVPRVCILLWVGGLVWKGWNRIMDWWSCSESVLGLKLMELKWLNMDFFIVN